MAHDERSPRTDPAGERLVTVRSAARRLGMSRHVLFRAAERGEW